MLLTNSSEESAWFVMKNNLIISVPFGIWLVCASVAMGTRYYGYDIGFELGLLTWGVTLGGIGYCVLKGIDNLLR